MHVPYAIENAWHTKINICHKSENVLQLVAINNDIENVCVCLCVCTFYSMLPTKINPRIQYTASYSVFPRTPSFKKMQHAKVPANYEWVSEWSLTPHPTRHNIGHFGGAANYDHIS